MPDRLAFVVQSIGVRRCRIIGARIHYGFEQKKIQVLQNPGQPEPRLQCWSRPQYADALIVFEDEVEARKLYQLARDRRTGDVHLVDAAIAYRRAARDDGAMHHG